MLVVEDPRRPRAARKQVEQALAGIPVAFAPADQALAEAERTNAEAILIDVTLPGADGFEVCRRLRRAPSTSFVPQGFLERRVDPVELRAQVRALLLERAIAGSVQRTIAQARLADERDASELTANERAVLESGGFPLDRPLDPGPLALHELAYQTLLESSLTTEQAAKKLRVQASRIRQRLTAKPPELVGITVQGAWRLPAFQFGKRGLIPNIEKVITRLAPGVDAVALERWFKTATPDLVDAEQPMAPLAWLAAGKPWAPVAELAAQL